MAKIVLSEDAPQGEKILFSLPGAEPFEAPYETGNPVVLANAEAHPWLTVEVDADVVVDPPSYSHGVDPTEDPLSALYQGDDGALPAEEAQDVQPLAIEAGLDQNDKVVEGGVAQTLAADEDTDKPRRSSARKGD